MKEMKIEVFRLKQTKQSITGDMYLNGEFFCYTLEDIIREEKVYGETAIDTGTYTVKLTMSNRFKRIMPLLLNVPKFEGIRIHGGNTHKNTHGCILVAFNKINDDYIQGTAEAKLTEKLKGYDKITITIKNSF